MQSSTLVTPVLRAYRLTCFFFNLLGAPAGTSFHNNSLGAIQQLHGMYQQQLLSNVEHVGRSLSITILQAAITRKKTWSPRYTQKIKMESNVKRARQSE